MKPVLAVEVLPGAHSLTLQDVLDDVETVIDNVNRAIGAEVVTMRLLSTGEELRQYESGELVMYRKPRHRKVGDRLIYEKDGERVELQQERLPL